MAWMAWRGGRVGHVLDANDAFGQLLGVSAADLVGHTLHSFLHTEELGIALVPIDAEVGRVHQRRARFVKSDGSVLWVNVTASVVEVGDRATPGRQCALVVLEDVTAQQVAEATLSHQALHDSLTGVLNRYALIDRLEASLSRLWRSNKHVAVLFCDLDGFKNLNDTLGHRAGDEILVTVAQRLRAVKRPQDTISRVGGDEFVMICDDLESASQAQAIGERICEALRTPFHVGSRYYGCTVSVGITTTSDPQARPEDLLRRADLAMYRSKDGGRNRVEHYVEGLENRAVARVESTEILRRALLEDRVSVHYQPILDLMTGRLVGVEALARIARQDGTLIWPDEFIAAAEVSGLVSPLGERVLDVALDQLAEWSKQGLDISMNVNCSARQLAKASFAPAVFERLILKGLQASALCLEVTEGAVVQATGPTLITLRRLRSFGVHVGIDDFGTGYSSLTALKYMSADVLKIDRSFVEGVGTDRDDTAIVKAVITMSHDLGRTVIAEGVEQPEQAQALASMGCDQVQGFLYGAPIEADQMTDYIAQTPVVGRYL
ncbi:MAG: EAL domain-containing protein [Actinomycetes bacterium]